MRNATAVALRYAEEGISQLSGLGEKTPVERLDKCATSLRGLASLIGTQRPVDGFDPDGLATMLNLVADDIERAMHIAQLVMLQPPD